MDHPGPLPWTNIEWIIAVAFVAAAVAGQVRPCLTRTRPLLMKWHQMLLIEPFLFSKHEGC